MSAARTYSEGTLYRILSLRERQWVCVHYWSVRSHDKEKGVGIRWKKQLCVSTYIHTGAHMYIRTAYVVPRYTWEPETQETKFKMDDELMEDKFNGRQKRGQTGWTTAHSQTELGYYLYWSFLKHTCMSGRNRGTKGSHTCSFRWARDISNSLETFEG